MKIFIRLLLLTVIMQCSQDKSQQTSEDAKGNVEACTEIGCTDGFTIRFSPSSSWKAGTYRFTVKHDDQTTICEGSIPLKPCGSASLTCDSDKILIGESGCALPEAQHGFSEISSMHTFQKVDVKVERDGAEIANKDYTLTYKTVQPNGPQCEPTCNQAAADDMTVPQ
jgi:hypothetical protein